MLPCCRPENESTASRLLLVRGEYCGRNEIRMASRSSKVKPNAAESLRPRILTKTKRQIVTLLCNNRQPLKDNKLNGDDQLLTKAICGLSRVFAISLRRIRFSARIRWQGIM